MGSGPPPPLNNHTNIGFLSNTGPDPLNNHKATKPAFNDGPSLARQRNAIENGIWLPSSNKIKRCQSWILSEKNSGSAHDEYLSD